MDYGCGAWAIASAQLGGSDHSLERSRDTLGIEPLVDHLLPQTAQPFLCRPDVVPTHVEQNQLKTWGRIIALTRQAIINDDLGAFTRLAAQFGFAAAALEGDAVYGILTRNPVMSDGNALFSAAHKNLANPAGIDLASMTAARQLMAGQTSSDGQVLGITPMFLICGPLLETAAYQFTSSMIVPTTPGSVVPPYFKTLNVVVDPRITDASWYLAASPNQIDTIEYAYLEGAPEGGPRLDSQVNWDIDGIEYRCREGISGPPPSSGAGW
jgi:hypothetical protein